MDGAVIGQWTMGVLLLGVLICTKSCSSSLSHPAKVSWGQAGWALPCQEATAWVRVPLASPGTKAACQHLVCIAGCWTQRNLLFSLSLSPFSVLNPLTCHLLELNLSSWCAWCCISSSCASLLGYCPTLFFLSWLVSLFIPRHGGSIPLSCCSVN